MLPICLLKTVPGHTHDVKINDLVQTRTKNSIFYGNEKSVHHTSENKIERGRKSSLLSYNAKTKK